MSGLLLLDSAAYVVNGVEAELDDVERVQHVPGVRKVLAQRGQVAAERVQCRFPDVLAPLLGASREPCAKAVPLRPGTTSSNRAGYPSPQGKATMPVANCVWR